MGCGNVISSTYIICGEYEQYCSTECMETSMVYKQGVKDTIKVFNNQLEGLAAWFQIHWLCLDRGGEEVEIISKKIRELKR